MSLISPESLTLRGPDDGLFRYFFSFLHVQCLWWWHVIFPHMSNANSWREQDGIDYYYSGTDEEFEEYFIFVRQMVLEDYILQFPDTACFLTVRLQSEGPLSTILQCSHHTTSNEEIFPAFMQTLDDAVAKKVKCLEEMQNGLLDGTRDLSYGT